MKAEYPSQVENKQAFHILKVSLWRKDIISYQKTYHFFVLGGGEIMKMGKGLQMLG